MSVSLISQPPAAVALGNCMQFGLSLSDGGSGSIVKSTGYQLLDGSDNELSSVEQIPYTGSLELANVAKLIRDIGLVYTALPDLSTSSITEDVNAKEDIKLIYGEIQFDSDTCETTQALTNESDPFRVVNAAFQWFQDDNLTSLEKVLTNRPLKSYVCKDQYDWLHVWTLSATIDIKVTYYFADGTSAFNTGTITTPSNDVYIIPIGPANPTLHVPSNAVRYKIELTNQTPVTFATYWFIIDGNCCPPGRYDELYFLEPSGGNASIKFDDVQVGGNVTSDRFNQFTPCYKTETQYGADYGLNRINAKAFKRFSLSKTTKYVDGIDVFLDGLFSTERAFMRFPYESGDNIAKFIIDDADYQIINNNEDVQITVSGRLHLNNNIL